MYVCGRSTGFSDGDKLEFNALARLGSVRTSEGTASGTQQAGLNTDLMEWLGFAPLTFVYTSLTIQYQKQA